MFDVMGELFFVSVCVIVGPLTVTFRLNYRLRVAALHGNKNQGERDRVLNAFRGGQVNVLVATDVAARGLGKLLMSIDLNALKLQVNNNLFLAKCANNFEHLHFVISSLQTQTYRKRST